VRRDDEAGPDATTPPTRTQRRPIRCVPESHLGRLPPSSPIAGPRTDDLCYLCGRGRLASAHLDRYALLDWSRPGRERSPTMLSEGCSELRNWCDVEGWILRFGLVCREQHASELVIKYRQHLGWPGARASERQCVIEAPDRTATTHGSRLNNVGGSETHRWRAFENRRKLRCVLALVVRAQAFDADRFGGRVQPRLDLDHTASLRAACGPRCGIVGAEPRGARSAGLCAYDGTFNPSSRALASTSQMQRRLRPAGAGLDPRQPEQRDQHEDKDETREGIHRDTRHASREALCHRYEEQHHRE
jgi:hypothetical protein